MEMIPKREDASDVDLLLKSIKECCNIKSVSNEKDSDLKSIYLEGELPHDSKILVAGSETTTEKITHEEDDSVDEEAVKQSFAYKSINA